MSISRALVVGGGIGGMAAAIALTRTGVAVDLIDLDPDWKVYGTGITITGPTLRAFRDLDLLDAIARDGFLAPGAHMFLFDGTLLTTTVAPPIEPGLPSSGGIMRPKLHEIMSQRVRDLPIDVRLGVTVDRLEQDGDGVDVRTTDGAARRYDLVVGADGIFSALRDRTMPHAVTPDYVGQVCWRIAAPRPADLDVAQFYFGHRNIAGIVPCSHDQVYAFILEPVAEPRRVADADLAAAARDLLAEFGGLAGAIRDGIGSNTTIIRRPLEYVLQPLPWHQGRVVLIGDAVHATTPNLASGAGIAVEDALVLAQEVAVPGRGIADALAAFENRRFERCKLVVEGSVAIARSQLAGADPAQIGIMMGRAMGALARPI